MLFLCKRILIDIKNKGKYLKTLDYITKMSIIETVRRILAMARPKRFSEKLVVGLTPEMKEFLQKESEKNSCDMNVIVRRAIMEYMEKRKDN